MSGVKNYKISVRELNGSVVFLRKIMRGGANRSFGIEVASLAGIPSSVTGRAKEILKAVESGDKSRMAPTVEAEPADEIALTEIERIIMDTDLDNLSPMQAFLLVSDLKEKVKK